jgi:hypothetical protein
MGGSYIALLTGFYVDNGPFPYGTGYRISATGYCLASSAGRSSGLRYGDSAPGQRITDVRVLWGVEQISECLQGEAVG